MITPPSLTVLVLTFNEEIHIERCLKSVTPISQRIVLIDSYSTDRTCEIAQALGAEVLKREWPNSHANQFNWGLEAAKIESEWVLRIDADEYLTNELAEELSRELRYAPKDVAGFVLPRLVLFQGEAIRHGGFYPQWLLRVFRNGHGRSEERLMDEHLVVEQGQVRRLRHDLVDDNLNSIYWWTNKHNNYARREAADLLCLRHGLRRSADPSPTAKNANQAAATKRWVKENVYAHLPLGLRASSYFFYRFFIRAGFMDPPKIWAFHFLQAAWYRTLVDVNISEFERSVGPGSKEEKVAFLEERWGITLP